MYANTQSIRPIQYFHMQLNKFGYACMSFVFGRPSFLKNILHIEIWGNVSIKKNQMGILHHMKNEDLL